MLNIGEKVLYGGAGACTITGTCVKKFGDKGEKEYYVLVPVHDSRTTLYVPVGNATLEAKMKKLLSAQEIEALIDSMPKEEPIWINDEKTRQESFKDILRSGDRRELIGMTKALYNHRQKMMARGRKLHMNDERVLKEAEKLICEEFAVVLDINPSEVMPFIIHRLDGQTASRQAGQI
jgi:CarD family transcriptional regulator